MLRIHAAALRPVILAAAILCTLSRGVAPSTEARGEIMHVTTAGTRGGQQPSNLVAASLQSALAKGLAPGTVVEVDDRGGPLAGDVSVRDLQGEPGKPIVICGPHDHRAVICGRLQLTHGAHVILERLAFEPDVAGKSAEPWVNVEGQHVEIRDCSVTGAPGDGLRLVGTGNLLRGGEVAASEGCGAVLSGAVWVDGLRAVSCRQGGLRLGGDVLASNCLLLHNRGPAVGLEAGARLRFYHNLVYDNDGGLILGACRSARVLNNIFVNNYATMLLGGYDYEIDVPDGAQAVQIDHNVYFRHPGKDKLLRGLPYAQGVDLTPLAADNPFGLRLRLGGKLVTSLVQKPWAEKFDMHSQCLDILQRFTGPNSYTRSYEDLFLDFQQEDFRPRFTSPVVGRGLDLTAEVVADVNYQPRSARHPDIGPFAAPAVWWQDIDSGRATIVDGSLALDGAGRDCGLGTIEKPFTTLAKAAAFARWGSRIYVKDSIYRHSAVQTTFSLGPDSVLSGFPGHRPAFSPSEFVEPARWEEVTVGGLYRVRDWHTFLGGNCRMNSWPQDYYGNMHVGGRDENVSSLGRDSAKLAEPFRPIRIVQLDRDTPQVLVDGVALQQAGGVLGLEEFPIGTLSVWGRAASHLRPGSFMVGRRDFLLSKAVGKGTLQDGQQFLEGPNHDPEFNYRVDGHNTGPVSEFLARPATTWHAIHSYAGGDRLWKLDPAVTAALGKSEKRPLMDGWRQVQADKDSACWVRQFALPACELARPNGAVLRRHEARLGHAQIPLGGWLQRQFQSGDPTLAAVLDNPYQDYLEVRLPAGVDPNRGGLSVSYFTGRIEAVWRKAAGGEYTVSVNAAGLAMMSLFRTMDTAATAEATAATAAEPWQFGFLVPLGESLPVFLMRMPGNVDPNAEDPWRFTVVDDCLYVHLPKSESPAGHSVEAACNTTNYTAYIGGNSSLYDWRDAGPLRPDWPAVRVYRTPMDFGGRPADPLWPYEEPSVVTQGFEIDPADPTGRTVHLLGDVRLDVGDPPGKAREKVLIFRYGEGQPAAPVEREYRVRSKQLRADRRVVLPSKPVALGPRYVLLIAPADRPQNAIEQQGSVQLRQVKSRTELAQGTYCYDAAGHALYVCPLPGVEPSIWQWGGGRGDPFHLVRGLYTLGGNAFGHQKQERWGSGLSIVADTFDDMSMGFNPGGNISPVPGSVVRDCTFRWCGGEMGSGGELSGDERHTADRIKRPELHVDHCIFDVSNSSMFDYNGSPTKNIPFGNHHIWENNYFLPSMGSMMGPWWDQYCFNNVVQNNIFAGRGGVDVEVGENMLVRNNIFATDKGSFVAFRGSDRGYVINNTTFRGGGVWYLSSPEPGQRHRAGPAYLRAELPVAGARAGPLAFDRRDRPRTIHQPRRPLAAAGRSARGLLLRELGLSHSAVDRRPGFCLVPGGEQRGGADTRLYFHDPGCAAALSPPEQRQPAALGGSALAVHPADRGSPPRPDLHAHGGAARPDLHPLLRLSKTEVEVIEPLQAGQSVEVWYYGARGRQVERFPITAAMLTIGRPRLRLGGQPADERLFVGLAGQRPPLVRVTGSWTDVRPFEAEMIPGGSIVASSMMGVQFNVLRGFFPYLKQGDQFESVFHSRSVYHLSSLNNVFLDIRSHVASDAMDNPSHGVNYMLQTEQTDASHSQIDYNCYWKDLHAVPGPLSALIHWGKQSVWNSTADKEGITLAEFFARTGYDRHGLTPPSYFALVANPLRFDFRPLPDSLLLGAGAVSRQQVGSFLFDPDAGNGYRRNTYKGNEFDLAGRPRGDRPTIGALQDPLPGAKAYYLAPNGVDGSQRGSRAAPWATADYALARMRPGDLLVLLHGTYRQPIVVHRSGTRRDFLHIVAENPPYSTPPKFPTSGPTIIDASSMGNAPAVLLDGCGHVRVAGLRVVDSKAEAAVELRNTRDCVIEYVFVEKAADAGIRATGRGNTLYECSVAEASIGYRLAGSLTDVRWCAANDSHDGFRATGPVAGLYLLQNRQLGKATVGFSLEGVSSDVVLDGNWAETAAWAYQVGGLRIMLVNNIADHPACGIGVGDGADFRLLNNNILRCRDNGLVLGGHVRSGLILNNVLQADMYTYKTLGQVVHSIWLDYNLYSRSSLPFQFNAWVGGRTFTDLAAWSAETGWDCNSRVAPLVYSKMQDRNGRWRVREVCAFGK